MTISTQELPIVEKVNYLKDGERHLELPRQGLIRRLTGHFKITISTGANAFVAGDTKNNGILNILRTLRLEIGRGTQRFRIDGPVKYYVDLYETGTRPVYDALTDIGANSSKTFNVWFVFDFASIRSRLSDFTQLLNAPANPQNDLYIEWAGIDALYPNGTNPPAEVEIDADKSLVDFSYVRAYENGSGTDELAGVLENLLYPREGVSQFPITRENTSFDDSIQEIEVNPVRTTIMTQMLFALKNVKGGNPTYDNDIIRRFKYVNPLSGGTVIFSNDWEHTWLAQRADFKLYTHPKGMIYMDWLDQRQGGLRNINTGDLKLRLLTDAPEAGEENAVRIYTKYIPQ